MTIQFTETYTWKQSAVKSKLDKLRVELNIISFAIENVENDIYSLSQFAAIEGMKAFAQRVEDNWLLRKSELLEKFPKFDFDRRFKIRIFNQPVGKLISFEEFIGFDYQNQPVNIKDYRECDLAHALLEPPYGIKIEIDAEFGSEKYHAIKTKEFTALYRLVLDDFVGLSEYSKEDFIIYSWSDDWSNFFDAGKEWWGTFYWTVYNKKNTSIIILGASATD